MFTRPQNTLTTARPHRYTGIFRFDGDRLRTELLFDRNQVAAQQGADVPPAATNCSLIGRRQVPVNILNAAEDPQAQGIKTTVISYCGVLIPPDQGQA